MRHPPSAARPAGSRRVSRIGGAERSFSPTTTSPTVLSIPILAMSAIICTHPIYTHLHGQPLPLPSGEARVESTMVHLASDVVLCLSLLASPIIPTCHISILFVAFISIVSALIHNLPNMSLDVKRTCIFLLYAHLLLLL